MFSFLYPFFTFLQPGVLFPGLASLRPMLVISVLAGLAGMFGGQRSYSLSEAVKHPVVVAMTAFILVQVASLYYGGVSSMLEELGFWHVYLLFVVISLLLITSEDALRRYVYGMIAGSMVVVVYGIYAVFAHLAAAVGGRAGAFGMYENHNDYSFIIIMAVPFIYMLRQHETRSLRRLLLGLSLVACIVGILLSLSRGGVVALVLELVLIVFATVKGQRRFWYVGFMVLLGSGAIGYQWAKRAANQGDSYTADDAQSSRLELWKAGANMVQAKPLLGVGSRHFAEFGREYGELSGDQIGKNSHNTYIEVVSTSGLLGFIAFLLMLRAAHRELRNKITQPGHEWLDSIRSATLISLWSIMMRGLLDAKPHDWSFYILSAITVSCGMLRRNIEGAESAPPGETEDDGGGPGDLASAELGR